MSLYTIVLYFHFAVLSGALICIAWADESAFAWIFGKKQTLDAVRMHRLHIAVSFFLGLLIASGLWLFWPLRSYLLFQAYFLIKMAFVSVLVLNSLLIHHLMPVATTTPFAQVETRKKITILLSGAISSGSWLGAILCAYLLFGWLF